MGKSGANSKESVSNDCDVSLAIMQEAQERLTGLMSPKDASKIIASFGVMGLVETHGYQSAVDLTGKAIAAALQAQARRGIPG